MRVSCCAYIMIIAGQKSQTAHPVHSVALQGRV
jgi:hypothetical protein